MHAPAAAKEGANVASYSGYLKLLSEPSKFKARARQLSKTLEFHGQASARYEAWPDWAGKEVFVTT
eukprot:1136240-Pelagomonas_calceolata.AAC.12